MGTDTSRVVQRFDAVYRDEVRSIWGDSDSCNFGYWRPETSDHEQARENLVAALLAFIPDQRGRVLDRPAGSGRRRGTSPAALLAGTRPYLLVAARRP